MTTGAKLEDAVSDDDDWSDLAAHGLTMLEAARIYDRPLWQVRMVYVWGVPPALERIGKADEWSVWRARPADVRSVFGKTEPDRSMASAASQRAANRASRLRDKLKGER